MAAPDYEMCGPVTHATRDESPATISARSGAGMQRQQSPPRAAAIAAREFSVGTLTMIFEVISRRRPASHLQHRVGMQVDDQIDALARARAAGDQLSLIHISEPTRLSLVSRMPSSA